MLYFNKLILQIFLKTPHRPNEEKTNNLQIISAPLQKRG